jgi:glycosyltransferase involved in cell wall biosynthesis
MSNELTVVVLSYNRLETLKESLASLKYQTLRNFDLLISDNGSEAKVVDYINTFNWDKGELSIINHSKNIGYTENLKNAIMNVRSKYISFLSDDNLLYEKCLEELLLPFKNDLSEISISFSNHILINEHGQELKHESTANNLLWGRDFESSTIVPQVNLLDLQIVKQIIPIDSCVCITKQMQKAIALEKFGLDHTLFTCYVIHGGNGYFVSENLMKYRVNPKGMSQSQDKRIVFAQYKIASYENFLQLGLINKSSYQQNTFAYHLFISYYTLYKYNVINLLKLIHNLPKIKYLNFIIISKILFLVFTRKFLYRQKSKYNHEL